MSNNEETIALLSILELNKKDIEQKNYRSVDEVFAELDRLDKQEGVIDDDKN
ncbi:TPA: hypothetical protein QDB40_004864 [Burkholderia vietnamiensis]|uniref:hypothetical protein n=1 Tax=Burkholderia cepacia complex TaxID=87882 RepID=UPI001594BB46|nr:hypothetical protein [Burkholderia vietnamiensis]HDR9102665.1 hypothetical protein [Burkholderia vietnamiensis]HDR9170831.1 hypothetical protein [Burkholderia vietnamiensis]